MSRASTPIRLRRVAARRGFTLAEMLIGLVLFSLVGGSILSLMMRQQRFHRSTTEVIKLQGQLRHGASALPLDLRGISTSDPNIDVYARGDASIDFRRIFGSSVVCSRPALNTIMIYPSSIDSARVLTTWAYMPVVGDSLLVLDEGRMPSTEDDTWRAYEVRVVAAAKGNKGCPWKVGVVGTTPADSAPLLYASDTVRTSYRIGLDQNLAPYVRVGAPIRFFRRVRYQRYVAGDGKSYLGYSDCLRTYATASLCSDPTPVSGPYQADNGIAFSYFDPLGNPLAATDPSRLISRVDVALRGTSAAPITRTGAGAPSTYRDSLLLSIGIRNYR